MASLTVRNIPDDAKLRFRKIAAAHGRSMEEHLRQLVLSADGDPSSTLPSPTLQGVRDVTQSFRHFEPNTKVQSRARIERLIELGRGLEFEQPERTVEPVREIDFS